MIARPHTDLNAALCAARAGATATRRRGAGSHRGSSERGGPPEDTFSDVEILFSNRLLVCEREYARGSGFIDLVGLVSASLEPTPCEKAEGARARDCVVCGRSSRPGVWVHVTLPEGDMSPLVIRPEDAEERRELGDYVGVAPVGAACYRRHRNLLDLFAPTRREADGREVRQSTKRKTDEGAA